MLLSIISNEVFGLFSSGSEVVVKVKEPRLSFFRHSQPYEPQQSINKSQAGSVMSLSGDSALPVRVCPHTMLHLGKSLCRALNLDPKSAVSRRGES